jgi:hypothetical protein
MSSPSRGNGIPYQTLKTIQVACPSMRGRLCWARYGAGVGVHKYLYDYGDSWSHVICVEEVKLDTEPYGASFVDGGPRCLSAGR